LAFHPLLPLAPVLALLMLRLLRLLLAVRMVGSITRTSRPTPGQGGVYRRRCRDTFC
jgi:hypothetical protein